METKNLCAQIPVELHHQISESREESGLTTAQYITQILTEYFIITKNGGNNMSKNRTMAFQISEELFQNIKSHLELETARTGKKLTQRDFVLSLIETALAIEEDGNTTEENALLDDENLTD